MNLIILLHLQIYKLVYQSFSDTGRRHEIPRSERKKEAVFFTAIAIASIIIYASPLNPNSHWVMRKGRKTPDIAVITL